MGCRSHYTESLEREEALVVNYSLGKRRQTSNMIQKRGGSKVTKGSRRRSGKENRDEPPRRIITRQTNTVNATNEQRDTHKKIREERLEHAPNLTSKLSCTLTQRQADLKRKSLSIAAALHLPPASPALPPRRPSLLS